MIYVVCVRIEFNSKTERWRRYRTLKLALAHARRNLKAGKFVWIEKQNCGEGNTYADIQ